MTDDETAATDEQVLASPENWLLRPGPGKLKYIADVAKTYAATLSAAAVITPAFSARGVAPVNAGWLVVALMLLVIGLISTPQE